jgi:hypothetical protein
MRLFFNRITTPTTIANMDDAKLDEDRVKMVTALKTGVYRAYDNPHEAEEAITEHLQYVLIEQGRRHIRGGRS